MKPPTGAWQRDWIHRRGQAPTSSVAVRYVQATQAFGDVRTPAQRAITAASFAELTDAELAELARQNGFAGYLTVDGDRATWHHELDFQPPSDDVDVGRVEPVDAHAMLEHALDGAYVERWSRLAPDDGRHLALRIERDGKLVALLVVAGEHFVYAQARATPLPPGASLTELIARTHATRAQIIGYLDCEFSYGTTAQWRIARSTLPWREGARLALVDALTVNDAGQVVARAPGLGAVTTAVENFDPAALRALFAH